MGAAMKCIFTFWVLIITLLTSVGEATHASNLELDRVSIEFENISVPEALDQLAKLTGVKISVKDSSEKRTLSRRYFQKNLETIIGDLLRSSRHFLVWHYGQAGLEAIDAWIFEDGGEAVSHHSLGVLNPQISPEIQKEPSEQESANVNPDPDERPEMSESPSTDAPEETEQGDRETDIVKAEEHEETAGQPATEPSGESPDPMAAEKTESEPANENEARGSQD